jgi:hypothetical protein
MRPLSFVFGVLLSLLGLLDLAFAYLTISSSSCGFDVSCAHPAYGYSYGWFRLFFGVLLLALGLVLIARSFRPRRWGRWGPGGWGSGGYGPRYGGGGYGPRGMGGMGPLLCPTCGGRNGPRFQHCRFCGAALGGAPAPPGGPPPPLQH